MFVTSFRPRATRLALDGLPSDFVLGNLIKIGKRNSIVCIATVLRAGRSGVPVPVGARDFSVIQNFQTGSEASYSKSIGVLSQGRGGATGVLTTFVHITPSLRMSSAIPLLPLYALMAWTGKTLILLYFTFVEKIQAMGREYYVRIAI